MRALIAVGIAFAALAFWPGPSGLYDLLAAPMVATLPQGATLIATNVISPFLVPLKITLMAAFLLACPSCSTRCGPSWRRGCTATRRSWCCRW
jgi:sec-independent protein translocase protein TatC